MTRSRLSAAAFLCTLVGFLAFGLCACGGSTAASTKPKTDDSPAQTQASEPDADKGDDDSVDSHTDGTADSSTGGSTGSSADIPTGNSAGSNDSKASLAVPAQIQQRARESAATFFPDAGTVEFPTQGYTVQMDGANYLESGTLSYVDSHDQQSNGDYRLWYDSDGLIMGLEIDGNQMFWRGTN